MTSELENLVQLLARLRAPGGCAWDREQTHESLVRYLVEETYELVDAIESGSREELLEELGDVLYQVLFHSDIAAHTPGEEFDIEDVAAHMAKKMVGRHPHVFGDATADTADAVAARWEDLKSIEKPARTSVLDGVPKAMPALALADKMLGKGAKTSVEVEGADVPDDEDALGDVLLSVVAGAREKGLDPERALRARLRRLEDDIRAAEAAAAGAME
ncbi:MazG family protein [Desertivibrio insolitus]|uniref:MazG family protein n=1 Tax=Herbiconiux sp. SYSU D00978 TaxID=2812562 RepID=UPI001A95ADB3|nr:MazG family protein [Herbiconiux sp. SYSU D00978]